MFEYKNQEPVRYTGKRESWNNGRRVRYIAFGYHNAKVINAARRGDFEFVLEAVKDMGWVSAKKTFARKLIRAAKKLPSDVSAYKIEDKCIRFSDTPNYRGLFIPYITHALQYRFNEPEINWMCIFGANLDESHAS